MDEYLIDKKYRAFSKTTTKGTQEKYKKDNYFFKINQVGNEGFVEYLCSKILRFSSLEPNTYVKYEYCKINGSLGCRSLDFLMSANEEFVTAGSLYNRLTGQDNLADYIMYLGSAKERLDFILKLAAEYGI